MAPIASIRFTAKNSGNYKHFGIDNLQLALYAHCPVQDISEPGTSAILGLGLAGLG